MYAETTTNEGSAGECSSSDTSSENDESVRKRRIQPSMQNTSKKQATASDNRLKENQLMEQALAVMGRKPDELEVFGEYIVSEMRQISDLGIRRALKSEIMKTVLTFVSQDYIIINDSNSIQTN